jgi:ubiquinone/menaquinone biosynthesis C-methylase UbiE
MSNFYTKLAKYYDHLYSFKDYKSEAQKLLEIIKQYRKSSGNTLLDVACGTGRHIEFFREYFETTGVDLNEEMLQEARARFSDAEFVCSDMSRLSLGKEFDVITCLFGSINYLLSDEELESTIHSFSKHTRPGGIVIIEPMFTKKTVRPGSMGVTCVDLPDAKIARVGTSTIEGDIVYLNFHFLLTTGEQVEHFVDPSPMKVLDKRSVECIMKDNGYSVDFITPGLSKEGLFVGVKA